MLSCDLEIQLPITSMCKYCCELAKQDPNNYLVESRGLMVCRYCGENLESVYVMNPSTTQSCRRNAAGENGKQLKLISQGVFDKYAYRTDFSPGSSNNPGKYAKLRRKNIWSNPNKTIYKRKIEIIHKCIALNLKRADVRDMAWRILLACLNQRLTSTTHCTLEGLQLASIYFACRIQKYDLFMSDLIGKTRAERRENSGFIAAYPHVLDMVKNLGYTKCIDRNMFIVEDIFKVGAKMGLEMKIIKEAESIMRQVSNSLNMLGKHRVPYAAAYLYISAFLNDVQLDIKNLAEKAGTSPVTINSRCDQIASKLGVEIKKSKGKQAITTATDFYNVIPV